MASTILKMASKLRNISQKTTSLASLRRSLCTATETSTTSSKRNATKPIFTLLSKISPLGNPSISIVPDIDSWAQDGSKYNATELRFVVKSLRSRRRFNHALQACEFLHKKEGSEFTSGDHAILLELIGKVRGLESAETYFNTIIDVEEDKKKLYSALLYCYAKEGVTEKALSLMKKMKDLGIANTLAHNSLMTLYKNTDQVDKIIDVLLEMKKDKIVLNSFSYKIGLDAYGIKSDFESMERLLKEVENQPGIAAEWEFYSKAANFYVQAGETEKALVHLKKCEELVGKDSMGYNHLISFYTKLGQKDEVMRLWGIQKENCEKHLNVDYVTMLNMLLKLEDVELAEQIYKEWESSCLFYDIRVPYILINWYSKKGFNGKAEKMLLEITAKGNTPTPNCWSVIADGYFEEGKMEKSFECMKKALALQAKKHRWRPKRIVIIGILDWLAEDREVEEVEAFMGSLKNLVRIGRQMYHSVIRAYVRSGKEVDGVLKRMKTDGLDVDEETQKILKSQKA